MVSFKRVGQVVMAVAVFGIIAAMHQVVSAQEPAQPAATPREEQLR